MSRDETAPRRSGTMRVVRSRGALSGFLLFLLGIWGALIPFVGPYFHYAYTPNSAWTWTAGRFWLELLPGIAAAVAGLMLMVTANRSVGIFAGWLASLAGAWFILGPVLGRLWDGAEGAAGTPVGGIGRQVWEQIGFFSGLGAVILFLAAQALGRFTVRSVADVRAAEAHADRRAGTTRTADAERTATPEPARRTEPADDRAVAPQETRAAEPARTDTVTTAQPTTHSGEGATRVETRRDG